MATITATTSQGVPPAPDMSLINELYEAISLNPPAIEARKLLVQQYILAQWLDAADDAAKELLKLAPNDKEAQELLTQCQGAPQAPKLVPPKIVVAQVEDQEPKPCVPTLPADVDSAKSELLQGYQKLLARAAALQREVRLIRDLQQQKGVSSARCDKHIPDLTALADGRISTVARVRPPSSARSVARSMAADPIRALDLAVTDLADMVRWLRRSPTGEAPPSDNDAIREALAKRVRALTAALPDGMKKQASTALMHVEHEVLQRTYICNETMLGDPVADIPRDHFYVTEDGYAWDLGELAQALTSNGGVMRNPLSRELFTPSDIRAIVQHPLGQSLAALQVEQQTLSQGVRRKTVDELDKLAKVLLGDMSDDQITSRHALDEFLAYIATLPEAEQNAIDKLRVPAKDSHTNQAFDTSIGEAVRDAQANRVCIHKTGDFLRQAATHLRQKK
jgi:hypothetical protein